MENSGNTEIGVEVGFDEYMQLSRMDFHVRNEALSFAVNSALALGRPKAEDVLAEAEKYYEFLSKAMGQFSEKNE